MLMSERREGVRMERMDVNVVNETRQIERDAQICAAVCLFHSFSNVSCEGRSDFLRWRAWPQRESL